MIIVETIAKIRRMHHVQHKGIKTIARELSLSKNTVKKIIREDKTAKKYKRNNQPLPIMGEYKNQLADLLATNATEPARRRYTAKKLYEILRANGFSGSYSTINRFVIDWKKTHNIGGKKVFIPLEFAPGEAFQFDWSEEEIKLHGELVRVKAAHIRLCYSRLFLIVVYRNEQLEMVLDAHDKAFQFFAGVTRKGIYDNMKTAVKKILIGKDREFNRRFVEMTAHYLFEPVACTPAAGWEKGQVEKEVNTSRRNFFTPLRCVDTLEELNDQLYKECIDWAQNMHHPEFKDRKVWDVYQDEKLSLLAYRYPFAAYKIDASVVSSYSLINYDTNMYSVDCNYINEVVEVRIYAKKIIILSAGKIIGEHERSFEKYKKIYDPLHYIAALEHKPGALRNGIPFKQLQLPSSLVSIRASLGAHKDGDKQFIKILLQILQHGLKKVDEACANAVKNGVSNVDIIKQYLDKPSAITIIEERQLQLKEPLNDDLSCYNTAFLSSQIGDYQEVPHAA